jgi:hypothetical protein
MSSAIEMKKKTMNNGKRKRLWRTNCKMIHCSTAVTRVNIIWGCTMVLQEKGKIVYTKKPMPNTKIEAQTYSSRIKCWWKQEQIDNPPHL